MDVDAEFFVARLSRYLFNLKHDRVQGRVEASMIERVAGDAVDRRYDALLASDVFGRPGVSVRIVLPDAHPVSDFECVAHRFEDAPDSLDERSADGFGASRVF